MLCQFQAYNKVIQSYIHIYPFFFRFFSHIGYYRILSRVPCALQQVLVDYLFYTQQCVHVNPKLLIYPSPCPPFRFDQTSSHIVNSAFSYFSQSVSLLTSPSDLLSFFILELLDKYQRMSSEGVGPVLLRRLFL